MEKTVQDDGPPPDFSDYSELEGKTAGHHRFNKRVSLQVSTTIARADE